MPLNACETLYIMPFFIKKSACKHADDTIIFASGKNREDLLRGLESELGELSDWFAHNRLTLNYDKTEFVNFSKPTVGASVDNWTLKIDGLPIREVNVSKFLGVYIDKNVSWRVHIGKLITKISQTVGIIGRARRFMNGPQPKPAQGGARP